MLLVLVFGSLFFLFGDKVVIVTSKTIYNLSVKSSLNSFHIDFNCKLWKNSQNYFMRVLYFY
jgi:hypothetical protein